MKLTNIMDNYSAEIQVDAYRILFDCYKKSTGCNTWFYEIRNRVTDLLVDYLYTYTSTDANRFELIQLLSDICRTFGHDFDMLWDNYNDYINKEI